MAKYVLKSRVLHNGKELIKGQECPKDLHAELSAKGLVEALPEPKPVEPEKTAQAPVAEKK